MRPNDGVEVLAAERKIRDKGQRCELRTAKAATAAAEVVVYLRGYIGRVEAGVGVADVESKRRPRRQRPSSAQDTANSMFRPVTEPQVPLRTGLAPPDASTKLPGKV